MTSPSPFVFDGPVPPDQVIDREEEIDTLLSWAREGRFLALSAHRRFGKTSLVRAASHLADEVDSMPVILVDLYGTMSVADLVIRLESAYRRWATGPFRRAVAAAMRDTELGLSLTGGGVTVSFSRSGDADPMAALHALLELPTTIASRHRGRVLIVFDEVQDLFRIPDVEATIRSHIQHQREKASYVFAGSQPTLLADLFGDRARPLYGQAEPLRLGRLDAEPLAEAVADRFAASHRTPGDGIDALLELVAGHPQRAMLAAHCLWAATPEGTEADLAAWEHAREELHRRVDDELTARWDRMAGTHRKVLRAIVNYQSPYRSEAQRVLGLASGSTQDAIAALIRDGEIERHDQRLTFVDPLLADWIGRRFP